jgi:hypothetical protein
MYNSYNSSSTYIEGLGQDPLSGSINFDQVLSSGATTIANYRIEVLSNTTSSTVILLANGGGMNPPEPNIDSAPQYIGSAIDWNTVLSTLPGKYIAGSSLIYITQATGSQVVGTFAINPLDNTQLTVQWNTSTLVTNTGIDSNGLLENISGYNPGASYRSTSTGTFDAIVNPQTYNPLRPKLSDQTDQTVKIGTRFLLVEDIGNAINGTNGAEAWEGVTSGELIAKANDIVEWTGTQWQVIFNSSQYPHTMVWQTNIYTGVQYLWNGVSWNKSYDGEYDIGQWNIVL